jgi:pilus assembly protein FimV
MDMDSASTMETPTIESPAMDMDSASTMETPTIESPAMDMDSASTMETPTIESPAIDLDLDTDSASTMATPIIESRTGQSAHDDPDAVSEQTAEIDLADLDLDLSGLNEMLDDDSAEGESDDSLSLDLSGDDDAGVSDELVDDVESTAEMRHLDGSGETAEQPKIGGGDTSEQPGLMEAAEEADAVFDIGDPVALDDDSTAEVEEGSGGNAIDGATMTEVGTKLDLARAYIDMGDPDGASSILKEVLEEAGEGQRQEAQQLLDDLQG